MIVVLLFSISLLHAAKQTTIRQTTTGWCSPVFANVTGNVIVTCIGVDPSALERLNTLLGREKLRNDELTRRANEWAEKYHELGKRLAEAGQDSELSRQAEEYLHHGELDKAGTILDKILSKEEKDVDRTAANHYNRALAFELQFEPSQALPHLEKAYRYRPENFDYALAYASLLQMQNQPQTAEPILLEAVGRLRTLRTPEPAKYGAIFASALDLLGVTQVKLGKLASSLKQMNEVIALRRQLGDKADLAMSLNTAAVMYRNAKDYDGAEHAYDEALEIERALAEHNPAYIPTLALTLNNISNFYLETGQTDAARESMQQALETYRELSRDDKAFEPDFAESLHNFGVVLYENGDESGAVKQYEEALPLIRNLANNNPDRYRPSLAGTLDDLGNTYESLEKYDSAVKASGDAVAIYKDLVRTGNSQFRRDLAVALDNLAIHYRHMHDTKNGIEAFEESILISRNLVLENYDAYAGELAKTLFSEGRLFLDSSSYDEAVKRFEESANILRVLVHKAPQVNSRTFVLSLTHLAKSYEKKGLNRQAKESCSEAASVATSLREAFPCPAE
jgi:Tfp pilus assembly protein PilF